MQKHKTKKSQDQHRRSRHYDAATQPSQYDEQGGVEMESSLIPSYRRPGNARWKQLGSIASVGAAALLAMGCGSTPTKAPQAQTQKPLAAVKPILPKEGDVTPVKVTPKMRPKVIAVAPDAGDKELPLHGVPKALQEDDARPLPPAPKKTKVVKASTIDALAAKQPALLRQDTDDAKPRRKGLIVTYVNGRRHGLWVSYHANGQKRRVRRYNKGQKIGEWVTYYATGQRRIVYNHLDGKRNGVFLTYFVDGKKRWVGRYDKGRKHGSWKRFRKSGEMDRLYLYEKGKMQRKQIVRFTKGRKHYVITLLPHKRQKNLVYFHRNGKMSVLRGYLKGRRHGVWTRFSSNGVQRSHREYREGKRHGQWKRFNKQGKLASVRSYMMGKRHGVWSRKRKDRSTELTYTDGKLMKRVVTLMRKGKKRYIEISHPQQEAKVLIGFHANGQKKYEYNATAGKRDGLSTEWYANGKKKKEMRYKDGVKQGASMRWFANGNEMLKGEYVRGRRHGTWKRWNYRGTRASEGTYIHGKRHGQWVVWNVKRQPRKALQASRLALKPKPKAKASKPQGNKQ